MDQKTRYMYMYNCRLYMYTEGGKVYMAFNHTERRNIERDLNLKQFYYMSTCGCSFTYTQVY